MAGIRKKSPELKEKIIEAVEAFFFEHHRSPSLAEIAPYVSVTRNTVHRYLVEMDNEGMLNYNGSEIRTSKTEKANFAAQCTPVVGRISCGLLEETEEDLEEFVALPTALFGKGDFIILRASGESMIDRGIDDGDIIVLERNVPAKEADIVAIRHGSGITLKQIFYEPEKQRICLHPWNRTMKDIYIRNIEDVEIYGVARHVIKKI